MASWSEIPGITVHELQFPGALVNNISRILLSLVGEVTCCVRVKSSTSSMNSSWMRLVVDCACVVFSASRCRDS